MSVFFHYLVFSTRQDGETRIAMRERTVRDIWQNLYDFYLIETDEPAATLSELVFPR